MKLTFKTLQQKTFSLEVEPTLKVSDVKKKLEETEGWSVASQKLIHSGKILADDTTVEDSKITEKDFIVVMVTKPKATTSSAPAAPATATTSAPAPVPAPAAASAATPDAPATTPATPAAPPPGATPAAAAPPANLSFDASTLATGSAYQAAVQNLVEMGFPTEDVNRAMKAAFNNPDRAAEYLMTGIPEGLDVPAARPPTAGAPAAA
ncbi:UV excision repair protein rhp23, partial [Chytridiales sp. JEL 0842]